MKLFKKNINRLIKIRSFWVLILSFFVILIVRTEYTYASYFFEGSDSQNQQKFRTQREQSKKRNKLTLEFYGGYSTLSPKDLHTGAQYIENLYDWYYEDRYQYFSSRYSGYFHYTGSKTGKFQKIMNAFPLGLRIKYYIRPRLAFSLGFQYISREETSNINYEYQVSSAIPDQPQFIEDYTRTLDLSPLLISVKGYTPLLGVHYEIPLSRSLFVESYLTGGLLFARFQFTGRETFAESNVYDFWEESIDEYDYKGSGIGYSLGAGVRAEWRAFRNAGLFIEGGYTLQRAGRIYGPGTYDYCYTDSNAPQICEPSSSWEAYWGLSFISASREWGEFSDGRLDAFRDKSESSVNNFHLDLSGFQLRIGLSLRIW